MSFKLNSIKPTVLRIFSFSLLRNGFPTTQRVLHYRN